MRVSGAFKGPVKCIYCYRVRQEYTCNDAVVLVEHGLVMRMDVRQTWSL